MSDTTKTTTRTTTVEYDDAGRVISEVVVTVENWEKFDEVVELLRRVLTDYATDDCDVNCVCTAADARRYLGEM